MSKHCRSFGIFPARIIIFITVFHSAYPVPGGDADQPARPGCHTPSAMGDAVTGFGTALPDKVQLILSLPDGQSVVQVPIRPVSTGPAGRLQERPVSGSSALRDGNGRG